jgi:phosphohistidine phosphatase
MLLRHAKSELSQPGMRDQDRPLMPRGRDTAAKIGAYIARHALAADRVLCSPALRTRMTWEVLAAALAEPPAAVFEPRLYNAGADAILEVVRETQPRVRSLLVIGHNPGLQELADRLIASGDVDHRERLREKLPTAGLVVIDFALDAWTAIRPLAGRLERFIVPRSLETATD